MLCVISPDTLKCEVCGMPVSAAHVKRNCRPGLGDRIASALSAAGITKARAQAVAKAVGLEGCGCAERQQLLNELGRRIGIGVPPLSDQPGVES
jgi:hypothetical protein